MKLQGKTAVVTGGARDIGRAVSVKLAKEGANVVVNYFDNEDDANETVAIIEKFGGKAIAVYADATNLTDIANLAKATKETFGDTVDVLVNVAGGLFARRTIDQVDESFYSLLMDVNFKSAVFVTQAFRPMMTKGSSVINFASQAARDGGGPGAGLQ